MKWFAAAMAGVVLTVSALAQTAPAASTRTSGVVTAVDSGAKQLTFKTDKGDSLTVTTTERTQILHPQAGENDPKKWAKITLSDISTGDEAVVYYRGSADQKPLVATSLVIRTKGDLSQLAQKQLDDWKKRGTTGTVTAVDAAAKTLTVKVGQKSWTVMLTDQTAYHRYSLDSAKVSDAKPSNFAEIKTGDQVNVLGDKSDDGASIKAETIYAGSFRQIAATIVSLDAGTGELKVTDLATKKPLTIRISSDSAMKKLPDQLAAMLARRYGVAAAGRGAGAGAGSAGGEGGGMRGGGGGGRGGDIGQMIERLPAMQISELKPKDAIMVSTTMGSDPSKVTAIMLLAGVEPILTAAPNATRDIMSGWNLGGGGGEGN